MPDFLDAERLAQISLVAIVGLFAIAIVVMQVVKAIVTKVLYLVIIGIAVLAVYAQRDEFKECQATCECTLFGRDVAIPDNRGCGENAGSLGGIFGSDDVGEDDDAGGGLIDPDRLDSDIVDSGVFDADRGRELLDIGSDVGATVVEVITDVIDQLIDQE